MIRFSGTRDSGLMSLGFPVIFTALLLLGPSAAVAVGLCSTLSSCLLPKRQPPHQVAFNVALDALAAYAAGLVFFDFNGLRLDLAPLRSFASVTLACLTFFLIDTGAVATVIGLCAGERPWRLWQEHCLWTAPSYFASAAVAALAIVIFGRHLGVVLLFLAPVALLMYQAYALYTTRAEENSAPGGEAAAHRGAAGSARRTWRTCTWRPSRAWRWPSTPRTSTPTSTSCASSATPSPRPSRWAWTGTSWRG